MSSQKGRVAVTQRRLPPRQARPFTPHPLVFRPSSLELSHHLLKLCVPGNNGSPESPLITLISTLTHSHRQRRATCFIFFFSFCAHATLSMCDLRLLCCFQSTHRAASELCQPGWRVSPGPLCLSPGSTRCSFVYSDTLVASPGQT